MEKLRWLEIENYRGIKQAKLTDFRDINVIVGKNNTGKSTILESIYLNTTAQDLDLLGRDPIRVIFTRRGIPLSFSGKIYAKWPEFDIFDVSYYFGYLFYSGGTEEPITFSSNVDKYGFRLIREIPEKVLVHITDYLEKRYSRLKRVELGMLHFLILDSFERPLIIAHEELREDGVSNIIRYIPRYYYTANKTLKRRKERKVILFDTHWLFHGSTLIREETPILSTIRRLDRRARINIPELVEFLSEQIGYEIISVESKLTDYYILTKNEELIPFSLLGDGTKMAIVYFYILSLKDSFILLEEPENHLHPKLMDRCIDLMVKSAKNNQIFITTHSLEFLEKMLEKAKDTNVRLRVFSITSLKNGILEYDSYDLDEAYAAVNKIGVDLR